MNRERNLETCLVISTGLIILWFFYGHNYLLTISVVLGITGLFLNNLAQKITWIWYKVSELLGSFVPKIVLTLVFFIILWPLAVMFRFFNKDSLQLKKKLYVSNWVERDDEYSDKDLENMW